MPFPFVSITSPSNGATFSSGASVTIAANASDPDGSVTKVDFYANGTLIGTDTSSPYSINWTIGSGTYALTSKATDNAGAATTSGSVSVTGQSGSASSMSVAAIVTGTASAGAGSKYGLATVTVKDNLGNPVSNATVSGTFSGTFSETRSGTTGANGTVNIMTAASAKGALTVDFCVNSVTHSTLAYNASQNSITCTGAASSNISSSSVQNIESSTSLPDAAVIQAYPNPLRGTLYLKVNLPEISQVQITLYDMRGVTIEQVPATALPAGSHILKFDKQLKDSGLYLIKVRVNDQDYQIRYVNLN
ncbi:Ig-like domain-containing protein [Pontibacter sp. MBLB2868]|uniref:Ig-like domain-containing protein n=1 Tax=Pontibacter sp. MBLB2868 TaxID=3451555 RepID=UPI003F754F61